MACNIIGMYNWGIADSILMRCGIFVASAIDVDRSRWSTVKGLWNDSNCNLIYIRKAVGNVSSIIPPGTSYSLQLKLTMVLHMDDQSTPLQVASPVAMLPCDYIASSKYIYLIGFYK